ncbi:hypothetical protein V2J09_012116 [Rumex salicifolius]
MALGRKQAILKSLCKHLSLDSTIFSGEIEKCDVKSLCSSVLKASQSGSSLLSNEEVLKWIAFADDLPVESKASLEALNRLNDELATRSVVLGNGLKLSEVDIIVFAAVHPLVVTLAKSDVQKLPHVLRWMDYVQSKEDPDLTVLFERLSLEKASFEPPVPLPAGKAKAEGNANATDTAKAPKVDASVKDVDKNLKNDGDKISKKSSEKKKIKGDKEAADEKKNLPEKATTDKDTEVPVSLLNIRVGIIRNAWKHPSADSLLVEEIDVGEVKARQVVSGLAKFCSPEELVNRRVVLITNVKPGKLRDVVSEGLVLCASNEDHSAVEPLLPPEGAKPGERIAILGHDGKPEDILNPKKKQLDKITPHLYTDENGIATYKGIPFMTSAGACTSSITKVT